MAQTDPDPAVYAHLAKMHVVDGRLLVDATKYLRLAHWTAIRFIEKRPQWRAWEDEFHEEAVMALLRAVENYRPEDGNRFTTYGAAVIYRWLVECAEKWAPTKASMSVDYQRSASDRPLHDLLEPKPEPPSDLAEVHALAESLLAKLSTLERTVIRERFWAKKSLRQIGDEMGICRQTVHNVELRALQAMGLKREKRHPKAGGKKFKRRTLGSRFAELASQLHRECRYEDALPLMRRSDCVMTAAYFKRHMAMIHGG